MGAQINIPIYRALKLGTKDEYVEGFLDVQKSFETMCISCGSVDTESYNEYYSENCRCNNCGKDLGFDDDNWEHGNIGELQYLIRNNGYKDEIDPSTLSIHFPDMLDRKGNKIFASINKNGRGSSVVFARILLRGNKVYFIYEDYKIKAKLIKNNKKTNVKCSILKIIGIKQ